MLECNAVCVCFFEGSMSSYSHFKVAMLLRSCENYLKIWGLLFTTSAVLGLVLGCSGGGNNSATNNPPSGATTAAPSSLVYPQISISAMVGQAISTDTPTVAGTVTSYAVSPALPTGISLNSSTGAISGTPSTAQSQTTYTITAANTSGTTTTTIQIAVITPISVPSSLTYPQMSITAMVGQAISPDTPTVTGTVATYTISPALPASLNLNSSTGVISGTPNSAQSQTSYTVTATNVAGSVTATLQITILSAVAAPSSLVYPQTTLTAIVNQAITANIPNVTNAVGAYSVSPALPSGLVLDTTTGAISGIPLAATAKANYTVTAMNAGGSATASISITVVNPLTSLLELGHVFGVTSVRMSTTRVLSLDIFGHWILSNYDTGAQIAGGDQSVPAVSGGFLQWPVDMRGATVAIGISNGIDTYSSVDGHHIATIVTPTIDSPAGIGRSWWELAVDGSYIVGGSQSGVFLWNTGGQLIASKPGNYSNAQAYTAAGQVFIALGPAGPNHIETIAATNGTSSIGPTFSGTFNSWFLDSPRFLTNTGNVVWTYSSDSTQQAVVSLPSIENMVGQGNWISTYQADILSYPLNIYAVGSNAPTATYNFDGVTKTVPSGNTIGVISTEMHGSVIDLSGATPIKTDYSSPLAFTTSYAAASASQWVVGNQNGVLVDGASLSGGGSPKTFALGTAWSIAGGGSRVAVATASGTIFVFDPSSSVPQTNISFPSSKLVMSSDGTILAASAETQDGSYSTDRSLKIFSLPSGAVSSSFPYQYSIGTPYLTDFSLSSTGTTLGRVVETITLSSNSYLREVTPIAGSPVIFSDTLSYSSPQISPDGTLLASPNGQAGGTLTTNMIPTTTLLTNGVLTTAVSGFPVGWIDNNRLLIDNYGVVSKDGFIGYTGTTLYDPTGNVLATPALPALTSFQTVTPGTIYAPAQNSIYSLSSGEATWTNGLPSTGLGAVAGNYVTFGSGTEIVVGAIQ
jgi:hypothetical protein